MFKDTKRFSELANYYMKHGHYPFEPEYNDILNDLNKGNKQKSIILPTWEHFSGEMQDFAELWIDRAVNGQRLDDGQSITGEYSHYLNCCWITKVNKDEFGRETRGGGFPNFWDEDWKYYWACEIARYGCSEKKLAELNSWCQTNIHLSEYNLKGGKDMTWGKPRGVGASWKGAGFGNHNLRLVPESKTFIMADKEEYLINDGLFSKFNTLNSFINEHCWWLKKSFVKESLSEMSFKTGIKEKIGGGTATSGFLSEIMGVTIDGDPDKARGKRGDILLEEAGSFPCIDQVLNVTEASVNEYGRVYGQRRSFGTGGDTKGGLYAFKKIFYGPRTYRILEFNNIYEESNKTIGFFTPSYRNINHIDKDGNSLEYLGKKWLTEQLAVIEESNDQTLITKFKAEFCEKPSDMFKSAAVNILPVQLAEEVLDMLEQTDLDRRQCTYGDFELGSELKFVPVPKKRPYEEFPVNQSSKEGCFAIYKEPVKVNGRVPDDTYIIGVDGYTQVTSQGPSIGSIRVIEQPNKYTSYKGDLEVAWCDARPEGYNGLNTFSSYVFYLAEYYNAKVMLENDQVAEIVSYAKANKDSKGRSLTLYLEEQPDLSFSEVKGVAMKKTMQRFFGINMTTARKEQGMKYFQEWLLRPRGYNSEGKQLLNIHFIRSRGLLREIIQYNGENADRISAMLILMFFLRQEEHELKKQNQKKPGQILYELNMF